MNGPGPTLDAIAADPARAAALPFDVRRVLTLRAAAVIAACAATPADVAPPGATPPAPAEDDRLLTPDEAARALGVAVPWLYRHARTLPFARKLSAKCLRFSEAGLRRWQATRRP